MSEALLDEDLGIDLRVIGGARGEANFREVEGEDEVLQRLEVAEGVVGVKVAVEVARVVVEGVGLGGVEHLEAAHAFLEEVARERELDRVDVVLDRVLEAVRQRLAAEALATDQPLHAEKDHVLLLGVGDLPQSPGKNTS